MNALISTLARGLVFIAITSTTQAAFAQHSTLGELDIEHPYSLPTPPGATTGAAYIQALSNRGRIDDQLVGASSPVADRVELHTMSMDGNVMRMRAVTGIPLPAGGRVEMAPGNGYHFMLIGIKRSFQVGDRIPLTLKFAKAGAVAVEVEVQQRGAGGDMKMH